MAPPPDIPVVQFVWFRANDRCLADPSLFQSVRDTAQGWQERGLNAQYWGLSVNRAGEFFWLLLWQSHAHATAIQTDPSYRTFLQDREALAAAPVFDIHVPFSGNPQRTLEAPVTEMSFYKTDDREVNPDARPVTETQELIRHITYRIESLQLHGFIALSWGIAIEDGRWGVYLGGWKSIEDHMRLGMLDDHKVFVEETEEIFKGLTDLHITYANFKLHGTPSSI